jgi:8-oxo-dGTP pyrophosphatase MutT (NUDIX family)
LGNQPIRCAARALIVLDGRLLTVILRDKKGDLHVLPGGGQMHGETLASAVRRECREELGIEINIEGLAYVREYIGANHGYAHRHRDFHQVEAVFHCTVVDVSKLGAGRGQDNRQVGYAWVPLTELEKFRFSPSILKSYVKDGQIVIPSPYLGDNH